MSLARQYGLMGVECRRYTNGADGPVETTNEAKRVSKAVSPAPKRVSEPPPVSSPQETRFTEPVVAAPVEAGPSCQQCGKPVPAPKRGKAGAFCSSGCRLRAHRSKAKP